MIGSGTPISQSNAPLPKPMVCLPLSVIRERSNCTNVASSAPKPRVGTRHRAKSSPQMEIEGRLKTALDESRLLILGAQVLFGFQFEAVCQKVVSQIPASSRVIDVVGV